MSNATAVAAAAAAATPIRGSSKMTEKIYTAL